MREKYMTWEEYGKVRTKQLNKTAATLVTLHVAALIGFGLKTLSYRHSSTFKEHDYPEQTIRTKNYVAEKNDFGLNNSTYFFHDSHNKFDFVSKEGLLSHTSISDGPGKLYDCKTNTITKTPLFGKSLILSRDKDSVEYKDQFVEADSILKQERIRFQENIPELAEVVKKFYK